MPVHVHVRAKLLQSRPTPCDPMDCSPPGSSVHGVLQAGVLEWVAVSSPRGPPHPGMEPASPVAPALAGGLFTTGGPQEACILVCGYREHLVGVPLRQRLLGAGHCSGCVCVNMMSSHKVSIAMTSISDKKTDA